MTDRRENHTYKVSALENGTVLDHLHAGTALRTLRVLALPPGATVMVGVNLRSERLGRKDIIKIDRYELTGDEAAKVALISPDASLSIIRDYQVTDKQDLRPPTSFRGLIRCLNRNCIVNVEAVPGAWVVTRSDPVTARCQYCDRTINVDEFEFF